MADSDFLVTISGAALSLLFYENVRSVGDQMGFLLGETLEFTVRTYTDAANQIETVKIRNNVETVVTCPLPELLHDSTGRINKEKLKDFLHEKSKQVIGWFRFRRNTSLVPTMRDKILHKEFASYFSGDNGSKEEYFVTCLLSSTTTNTKGTHKYRHVFLRRNKGAMEPVPLTVSNLSKKSFIQDGSDYKPAPSRKLCDTPDVFNNLVQSFNLDLTRMTGLESVISIEKAAETYLGHLIPQVCKSDLEVAELERQVRELKSHIAACKLNRKTKVNGSPNIVEKDQEVEKNNVGEELRIVEKAASPKIESESVDDETQVFKDTTTSTSKTNTMRKTRNTAACIANNVSQCKLKKTGQTASTQSPHNQDPLPNVVSEMKVNVAGTRNRNRRSTGMVSEIVKESICKGEGNKPVGGKGRGKPLLEINAGMKKAERNSEPTGSRSSSERHSFVQLSDQGSGEANCVQNPSPVTLLYSEAAGNSTASKRRSSPSSDDY